MSNLKKALNSVALVLMLVLIVCTITGCRDDKQNGVSIKIGVIMPLTGASSVHGQDGLSAIQMALEEINTSGGINGRKVEIVVEDNGSKPAATVEAMNKLVNVDRVPIIVGPISSSATLAGAEIADRSKTVLFSPTAASPKVHGRSPYCMRIGLMTTPQGKRMAKHCFEERGFKEIGILAMNDETGLAYADSFQEAYENLGGRISIRLEYNKTDTEFRTPLTTLKNRDVKVLYVTAVPRTMGFIIRQATELDFKPLFFANAGIEGEDFLEIAGTAANGVTFTGLAPSEEFVNQFVKKTGRQPSICAPQSYDAFKIVVRAMKIAGENREALRKQLVNMPPYTGVGGEIRFDETGEVVRVPHLKTVRDGRFVQFNLSK